MPKKSAARVQSYRDSPALDDAVSLHTQYGDYDTDGEAPIETPPAYSDEDGASVAPLNDPHRDLSRPIERNGIEIYMDKRADTDPEFLEQTITSFAQQPPRPRIQIKGHHTQTVKNGDKTEKKTITDFDISLDLSRYILSSHDMRRNQWMEVRSVENSQKAYRGSILKKRGAGAKADIEVGSTAPTLKEWCHLFCASPSSLKTFRLTRTVTGINNALFHDNIQHLIRSTNYKGHVDINFPVDNRAVEFHSVHRFNKWRLTSWIYWLFCLSMLWIFTWPYLFFTTKRWAVIEAAWPFSIPQRDGEGRLYAVSSEQDILRTWNKALERAVLEKRQGPMLPEDLNRAPETEFQSGNQRVDTVVGFLGAGVRAFNEVNRQLGWGGDC